MSSANSVPTQHPTFMDLIDRYEAKRSKKDDDVIMLLVCEDPAEYHERLAMLMAMNASDINPPMVEMILICTLQNDDDHDLCLMFFKKMGMLVVYNETLGKTDIYPMGGSDANKILLKGMLSG